MRIYAKSFDLTNENIIAVRDECGSVFSKHAGKRGNEKLQKTLELTIEEHLLRFKAVYGEGAECRVSATKIFGTIRFELQETGPQQDPLRHFDAEDNYSEMILQHLGQAPSFSYSNRRQTNTVVFEARQLPVKNRMLKQTILAVVLAVITALLLRLLPAQVSDIINESLVGPIFNKLTAVISAVATPLVFFGVITGMLGIGSSSAVGHVGKRLLRNMAVTYGVTAVIFTAAALLIYPVSTGTTTGQGDALRDLVQLVLDIVPSNLLDCFTIDNDLQVIVIAIFSGIVLLSLGEKAGKINDAVTDLSLLANKMMTLICKLLPLIVYLGILHMMLSRVSGIAQLYKASLALLVSWAIVIVYLLIRVKRKVRAPLRVLLRKQLPTLLINLTTSSQVAALPENMDCCKRKFGIDEKFVNFGLPLGIVAYMPCGAAVLGFTAWGIANMSGMVIDPVSVFKLALVSVVVAIAAPPIPGSFFAVVPVIFSSCSIPMDYYSVAIIFGTIFGYFTPTLNGFALQLEMLISAKELDLLDEEAVLRPED